MALDTMDSTGRRATEACPLFPQCTMDAYKIWRSNLNNMHNETSRNERSCLRYLPLFWPIRQLGTAVEHNLSQSQWDKNAEQSRTEEAQTGGTTRDGY